MTCSSSGCVGRVSSVVKYFETKVGGFGDRADLVVGWVHENGWYGCGKRC